MIESGSGEEVETRGEALELLRPARAAPPAAPASTLDYALDYAAAAAAASAAAVALGEDTDADDPVEKGCLAVETRHFHPATPPQTQPARQVALGRHLKTPTSKPNPPRKTGR